MAKTHVQPVRTVDPVWTRVREEAEAATKSSPELATFMFATVLNHDRLEAAVAHRVAARLDHPDLPANIIREAYQELIETESALGAMMRADIVAVTDRDPATTRYIEPILYFKGFHALQTHRLSHHLWNKGRKDFALYLQSRASSVFGVDINPQTKIGRGVLIGAGAKVLGNIEIGECSRVASGSVVLKRVPPKTTVAGIPARVVGPAPCEGSPAHTMDQMFESPFSGENI
jgi:serine O-acetyltransferase